jgi:hypothetical protein
VHFSLHADLRVPPAPGLPCALWLFMGRNEQQDSGEGSRENAQVRLRGRERMARASWGHTLRHCERNEAIQTVSAERFWTASAFAEASADKSLRSQ